MQQARGFLCILATKWLRRGTGTEARYSCSQPTWDTDGTARGARCVCGIPDDTCRGGDVVMAYRSFAADAGRKLYRRDKPIKSITALERTCVTGHGFFRQRLRAPVRDRYCLNSIN